MLLLQNDGDNKAQPSAVAWIDNERQADSKVGRFQQQVGKHIQQVVRQYQQVVEQQVDPGRYTIVNIATSG